jgi:hypothetical protein
MMIQTIQAMVIQNIQAWLLHDDSKHSNHGYCMMIQHIQAWL